MVKNFAIFVLFAIAAAGIGVGMLTLRKEAAMKAEADEIRAKWKVANSELVAAQDTARILQEQVGNLKLQLEEARASGASAQAVATKNAATAFANAKPKAEGQSGVFAKAMRGLRDDPGMQEMMAKQQELMVDQMFAPLLENLDLTQEETAKLRALLVKRQVGAMEDGLNLMGGGSREEKAELARQLGEQHTEMRAEIEELIGEENFQKFDLYEKSQQERQQISSFKDNLAGTGYELTFEQEEALMSAMYEERESFKFTTDFSKQKDGGAEGILNMDPQAVEQFMEEAKLLDDTVYQRVAEVLSPEQLEAFERNQRSFRSMQEFGIKMGMQMMRGEEEK